MTKTAPVRVGRDNERAGRMTAPVRRRGDGLRTCLGCSGVFLPEHLLRLSAGRDGGLMVHAGRGGGRRGAYLCYRRSCVESLFRKRRLSRALRAGNVNVGPGTVLELASALLAGRVGSLLVKARVAGRLVSGVTAVRRLLGEGGIAFVLTASDASLRTVGDLTPRTAQQSIPVIPVGLTRAELGALLQEQPRAGAAVRQGPLASALEQELRRLQSLSS